MKITAALLIFLLFEIHFKACNIANNSAQSIVICGEILQLEVRSIIGIDTAAEVEIIGSYIFDPSVKIYI